MKRVVVDASVAIKWYVPEADEDRATKLQDGTFELHAPELIVPEVSNILWKKSRLGDITDKEALRILKAFLASSVQLHSHRHSAQSTLLGAMETGQTAYDWSYLSLALTLSCPFVTADRRFFGALKNSPLSSNLIWIGDL